MNRKLDLAAFLLFAALLFGVIIRFYPALANGFPLNDGGMFYTMTQDLKANNFILPDFTTYNQAGIPFAYPPFGFYVAALLSALTPDSGLWAFLYLPALINSLSVLAFYLFAREMLNSRLIASAVTLFFALLPQYFLWQVMGGGITRAFGFLFMLLMLWQAVQLFKNYQHKHLLLAILFGAGAVTSHPQTALHAALGGIMLFIFYGRNKRGVTSAIFMGLGVALLSAPWWGTVLACHGLDPFLSAGQTSPRTWEAYAALLRIDTLEDMLAVPILLLSLFGLFNTAQPKLDKFFLVAWAASALLIDPRGADAMALIPFLLLAGLGLVKFSAWVSRMDSEQVEAVLKSRISLGLILGLSIFLLLGASAFGFQLVNTSLKTYDLEMIEWVRDNATGEKIFALATGREFSMSDPLQEWFPALTGQKSLTTIQGLEWTLNDEFFPWYEQLTKFQKCADINCVNEWAARNNAEYDYLIVLIPEATATNDISYSLRSLGDSVLESNLHMLVFENEHALIFELKK